MFKSKQKIIAEMKADLAAKDSMIPQLQANVLKKEEELREAKNEIMHLEAQLKKYKALADGTPSDCKRGRWCAACEFAKKVRTSYGRYGSVEEYFCGKGESCQNFVQKQEDQ